MVAAHQVANLVDPEAGDQDQADGPAAGDLEVVFDQVVAGPEVVVDLGVVADPEAVVSVLLVPAEVVADLAIPQGVVVDSNLPSAKRNRNDRCVVVRSHCRGNRCRYATGHLANCGIGPFITCTHSSSLGRPSGN